MKKITCLLLSLMLTLTSISVVFATTEDVRVNTNEIINEMIEAYQPSEESKSIMTQVNFMVEKADKLDMNIIASRIKNKSLPEEVRVTLLQVGDLNKKSEGNEWTTLCKTILNDIGEPDTLRIDAMWQLPTCENTKRILSELCMSANSKLAFQALKRMALDYPREALAQSKKIIAEYSNTEDPRLGKAIRIKAQSFSKRTSGDSIQFVKFCLESLNKTENNILIDTIFFALNDIGTKDAVAAILKSGQIDDSLKTFAILENKKIALEYYDKSNSTIKNNIEKFFINDKNIDGTKATNYLGYPIYRDGVGWNLDWHAGLMNNSSSYSSSAVVHLKKISGDVQIIEDSWSGFMGATTDFKGVYKPNSTYTSTQANRVVAKARELATENVQYTVTEQLTYHYAYAQGTAKGEPSDIFRIRCDGVVEYCFEYNNIRICGGDTYWNIAIKNSNNVREHRGGHISPMSQAGRMTKVSSTRP